MSIGMESEQIKPYRECRPDPEVMLQEARKRKSFYEKALSLFKELDNLPVNFNIQSGKGEAILALVGSITSSIWNEEKNIERLLKEIDEK